MQTEDGGRVYAHSKLDNYDFLRLLNIGRVVIHRSGRLCIIVGFDISKSPSAMLVRFKPVNAGDTAFDGMATDIVGMMVDAYIT